MLRFSNEEVYKESKPVLRKIDDTIRTLQGSPSGHGRKKALYVIKIGGSIIDNEIKLSSFLKEFALINDRKILVHGGGKLATQLAQKSGIEQKLIDGRRITDAATLKIVTMVYAGYINKNIVAELQSHGCNAIGLSGADGDAIRAHKRNHPVIDYGFVGDIDHIDTSLFNNLLKQHYTVVVAPITHNNEGQLLNTNADTIAQEIAKAMSSAYDVNLIYSFEKAGVLTDMNDENSVLRELTWSHYQQLKAPGGGPSKIYEGMLPKLDNAFSALKGGVKKVIIGKAEKIRELVRGQSGTTINGE